MAKLIIGIQGGPGSTNERACLFFAKKYGWDNFEIKYLISTENVLSALNNKEIDYGTFAWGSSRAGLVEETQEAIKKYSYHKIDEESFELNHALFQKSPIDKSYPVKIYSHQQALKEHKPFLEKEFTNPELIEEVDTGLAAKKLSDNQYPRNSLAIAPITCRDIYNLQVYMEDLPTNRGYLTTIYLVKV